MLQLLSWVNWRGTAWLAPQVTVVDIFLVNLVCVFVLSGHVLVLWQRLKKE